MKLRSIFTRAAAISLLASPTLAQIVEYAPSTLPGVSFKVNVPSNTAQSGSGPMFFQMKAPTSLQYLGMGQGTRMAGAQIFVMWAASESNVTISPRLGFGMFEPSPYPAAGVTILDGSGIQNGVMTANFRCEQCISWSDGSIDLKSTSSSMIFSALHGSPIDSADPTTHITFHDTFGGFNVDLVKATGGSSSNPFTSNSLSTSYGLNSGLPGFGEREQLITAHGFIMALSFVVFFPLGALTLHLFPSSRVVPFIHGPFQIITLLLVIAGMGIGISNALYENSLNYYHPIIGLIVVCGLVAFQPLMGILQHLYWRRHARKSIWAYAHRWFGRCMIILGMINGGLGLQWVIPGSSQGPWSVINAYIVITSVIVVFYVSVLAVKEWKARRQIEDDRKDRIPLQAFTEALDEPDN